MRRVLAIVLFVAATCGICSAQSISPVITEENVKPGKTFSGEILFTSTSLVPLSVVVEPISFTVRKDGTTAFRKLDAGIRVTPIQSAIVYVNQAHSFDFKASCSTYPCAFTLYAAFVAGHTKQGEAVIIKLPSTFYLCSPKTKNCRDTVRAQWGIQDVKPKDKS